MTILKFWDKKLDANGKAELKSPLLQPSNGVAATVAQPVSNADKPTKTIMFKVSGNESSPTSIESVLGKLNGIESVMVSPLQGQAVVRYMPELITVSQFEG